MLPRMFRDTAALFQQYVQRLQAKSVRYNVELVLEVEERFQQLDFIIDKVRVLERVAADPLVRASAIANEHMKDLEQRGIPFAQAPMPAAMSEITAEDLEASRQAMFETKLFTEAFYYFAARTRTILKNRREIPGLHTFECPGVRDVRNKLIEHAERPDSRIWWTNFTYSGPHGPVLKPGPSNAPRTKFPDKGLYVNAEEFRDNLNALLRRKLAET